MKIKTLFCFAAFSVAMLSQDIFVGADEGREVSQQIKPAADRETSYWDNGKPKDDKIYDKNGILRKQAFYREDGTIENFKKFNEEGNVTDDIHYTEEGRLEETADGWAAMTFEYKEGVLINESYYGANGKIMERKLYDNEGVLMAKQYVGDDNIDPNEEYNPAPVLNHERENSYFDENGKLEATTAVVD